MKKYTLILALVQLSFCALAQKNNCITNWKCFENIPSNNYSFRNIDTIFVLFQKSSDKRFYQVKQFSKQNDYFEYVYLEGISFAMQIFDYFDFKKINIRKSNVFYRDANYICKNMYRTIDVFYMYKFNNNLFYDSEQRNRKYFIIELDSMINNKYKFVEVNGLEYTVE